MSKEIKIVTVCGMGMGTSLILKMNVDEVLEKHNINAEVHASDLGSVAGFPSDLVVSTSELASQLYNKGLNTIFVKNAIDKQDIEKKVMTAIKEINKEGD